jgi:hypothetical protein
MANKRYAERKEVVNKEKLRQYDEEVCRNHAEDMEYIHNDLLPRLKKKRSEVAFMRLQLHEQEYELEKLEDEFLRYQIEDESHFAMVYDTRSSFEATLTDAQIEKLLPVINKYVFSDLQTVESMREWLECRNRDVKVKDIAELCNLLNLLRDHGYICGNAQTVAEENETFIGGRGRPITKSSLTASLTKRYGGYYQRAKNPILNKEIYDAVKALEGVKG